MKMQAMWNAAIVLALTFTSLTNANAAGAAKSWEIDVDRDGTSVTYIDDGYDDVDVYVHDDDARYDQPRYRQSPRSSVYYDSDYRRDSRYHNNYYGNGRNRHYYQRYERPRYRQHGYRRGW
jgi:hypothetical protein